MNVLSINSLATNQENWFIQGYRKCRVCDINVLKADREAHVLTRQHKAAVLERIKGIKKCHGCIMQLHETGLHLHICVGCEWPEPRRSLFFACFKEVQELAGIIIFLLD